MICSPKVIELRSLLSTSTNNHHCSTSTSCSLSFSSSPLDPEWLGVPSVKHSESDSPNTSGPSSSPSGTYFSETTMLRLLHISRYLCYTIFYKGLPQLHIQGPRVAILFASTTLFNHTILFARFYGTHISHTR